MAQPATTGSPLIFISYHADDQGFTNRLVSKLDHAAHRYGIWLDEVAGDARVQIAERTRTAVQQAAVTVLFISRRYLAATWAVSEEGSALLRNLPTDRQPLRFLMVDVKTAEELSGFAGVSYRRVNDVVLVEETVERQDDVLEGVKSMVERLLRPFEGRATAAQDNEPRFTLADLSKFDRSAEVKNVLRRACRLAVAAPRLPPIVTPIALLFGLAEGGRVEVDYLRTPQFLWKELTARGEEVYRKVLMEEFPGLAPLDEDARRTIDSIAANVNLVTPDVLKVFEVAEMIAHDVARLQTANVSDQLQSEIGTRHLLGALLYDSDGNTSRALSTIVGDVAALRDRFYKFIVKNLPNDDHGLWEIILTNLTLPEIPPPPQQSAAQQKESVTQPAIAGFMADDWTGDDLLGIERDVNALASLVAACNVNPPLSIGLFGDWGSGKSHFMRQMRKRVEMLSKHARESGKPQKELGYYMRIVQIEFNAWHYIEGNLWASLVDHIFANLRLSEDEPRTLAEARRDVYMQELGIKQELKEKINSKVQKCEDELRKLNERKEKAEEELKGKSTQLQDLKTGLETISVPITFTDEEKELLNRIDIKVGSEITGADVRKKYQELQRRWGSVKAQWKLFRSDPRVLRRYVLCAVLALIPVVGALLVKVINFPGLPAAVVSGFGVVVTLYVAAKPAWTQFKMSLKALEKHDRELEQKRQERVTELQSQIDGFAHALATTKLDGETVSKEIEKLKADIDSTTSTRLLAEFIEDRAAATDYRRHLGLLALIRRDFEKLRDLFEQQRKETKEGKGSTDEKKIDRIVLYIDDLDRCPPDRVVQVLQAIHLLLAFPLFVVVVGVDSRWITRSLQQSYEWLQEADEVANKNGNEDREENSQIVSGATPHDYLEKIFQLPFWLPSMNDDACVEFLEGLTKEFREQDGEQPEQQAQQADLEPTPLESIEHVPRRVFATGAGPTAQSEATTLTIDAQTNLSLANAVENVVKAEPQTNGGGAEKRSGTQETVDLMPRSLTFNENEIKYMKQLVPLIGRSPRAVKRFLNCYRLIKVGLTPAEFESFVGTEGESQSYKAAMILLGVITGTPAVSPYVINHLKNWQPKPPELTVEAWVNVFARNPEVQMQSDADRLIRFFEVHDFSPSSELLIKEMVNYAPKVSRFSFRLNRPDLLRRERTSRS